MRPLAIAFLGALLCASLPAQQGAATPSRTNLKVGDMAPDVTLPSTTGDRVALSRIVPVEKGSGAIDPSGAEMASSRLTHQ